MDGTFALYHRKRMAFLTLLIIISIHLFGQDNTFSKSDTITNSFSQIYKRMNPQLKYSYNVLDQIHDYSGNWDFDGDKKTDSLYFIGDGGAHLYYHLKIISSSNKKVYDFKSLLVDFPVLGSRDSIRQINGKYSPFPQFVVHDFDNDSRTEVYLKLDSTTEIPRELRKKGVKSKAILLDYQEKRFLVKKFDINTN